MMPKIPIFGPHPFLFSLIFFFLLVFPASATTYYSGQTMCSGGGWDCAYSAYAVDITDANPADPIICNSTVAPGTWWIGSWMPTEEFDVWDPWNKPTNPHQEICSASFPATPTPTPTPAPPAVCLEACGHTFESGCSPADEQLGNLIYWWFNGPLTGAGCAASNWQWSMLETQCPCEDETPDPVPEPPNWTPHPDPGPVYPELPQSGYSPNTVMLNPLSLLPRIDPIPPMNTTELRSTITNSTGNWTIPYMDWSDGVASIVSRTVTPISRLVNSPMVTINIYLLTWLELFDAVTTQLLEYAEAVTTVMGLAMNSLTDGIRLNFIYGLLLVFILLVIRKKPQEPGDT